MTRRRGKCEYNYSDLAGLSATFEAEMCDEANWIFDENWGVKWGKNCEGDGFPEVLFGRREKGLNCFEKQTKSERKLMNEWLRMPPGKQSKATTLLILLMIKGVFLFLLAKQLGKGGTRAGLFYSPKNSKEGQLALKENVRNSRFLPLTAIRANARALPSEEAPSEKLMLLHCERHCSSCRCKGNRRGKMLPL